MQMDAELAARLEYNFGPVRPDGKNFPGALNITIPSALAHSLHRTWSMQMTEKLNIAAAEAIEEEEEKLRRVKAGIRWGGHDKAMKIPALNSGGPKEVFQEPAEEEVLYNGDCHFDQENNPPVSREEINRLKERRSELYNKAATEFKVLFSNYVVEQYLHKYPVLGTKRRSGRILF